MVSIPFPMRESPNNQILINANTMDSATMKKANRTKPR